MDCHNEKRFFVSETDLKRGVQSEDDKEAAVATDAFKDECRDQVQKMLTYPSSFDESIFGAEGAIKDDAGNFGLGISFRALNGFGNKVPYHAVCMSTPTGGMRVRVATR